MKLSELPLHEQFQIYQAYELVKNNISVENIKKIIFIPDKIINFVTEGIK